MKTVIEYGTEMMEKQSIDAASLLPYMVVPGVAGMAAGKLYSDATAPPAGMHDEFQTDLLKNRLKDILIKRKDNKKIKKLEEVLYGSKRSLRI